MNLEDKDKIISFLLETFCADEILCSEIDNSKRCKKYDTNCSQCLQDYILDRVNGKDDL